MVEPYPGAFGGAPPPPSYLAPAAAASTPAAPAAADAAAAAPPPLAGTKRKYLRTCAGEVWEDTTMLEWPEGDYRLFCGDLGNEVGDDMLAAPFRKYRSFAKAKVIRDHRTGKSKGYGFVSFLEPFDALQALKEMHGHYIGNRPVRLKKSTWQEKSYEDVKRKDREMAAKYGMLPPGKF